MLRRLGVTIEQRVVLLLPDGPDFVSSFWGALKIGAVPVPTNTLLKARDYERSEEHTSELQSRLHLVCRLLLEKKKKKKKNDEYDAEKKKKEAVRQVDRNKQTAGSATSA